MSSLLLVIIYTVLTVGWFVVLVREPSFIYGFVFTCSAFFWVFELIQLFGG